MPRTLGRLMLLVVVALNAVALAQKDELAELQHKADTSGGGECARYSLRYAQRLVEASDKLYTAGNTEEALKLVRQAAHYAERGAECSLLVHKQQKGTEIALRELARRLGEIGRTLSSEDRPPIDQTIALIDKLRDQLLAQMFGGKASRPESAEK